MTRITFAALLCCACIQVEPWTAPPSQTPVTPGGQGTTDASVCFSCFDAGLVPTCSTGFDSLAPVAKAMPPAVSGGTMASLPNGDLVVGDPDRDALWLVQNRATGVRRVALTAGDQPGRVVAGPEGTAFVVLRRANQVAQVTVATGAVQRFDTCHVPRALVWRAASQTLLVGCADGTIEQHTAGVRTAMTLSAPLVDLRDLVPDGDGLIATTFSEAKMFKVGAQGTVTELPVSGVTAGAEARVAWRAVAGPSAAMVVLQTERTTPVALTVATCGAYGRGSFADGGVTTGLVVSTLAHSSGAAMVVDALLPDAVLPVDLAVNAEGSVAVVSAARNQVLVVGAGIARLMGQPTSIVAQPTGWAVFEREPAAVAFLSRYGQLEGEFLLPGASVASTGHELFHQATSANLACASCHPEGGEDGHVWNFDTGARRTQTLRGGLSTTAPFHWSGDELDMQSLVTDVMAGRMSGHQQTPDRTQALLSWLDAQPALEAPPTNAGAVARGEALFNSSAVGCAACHTGAQGTNNQTVSVGTGGFFQVPRLVELGWRTKWFHDGRVKTANERFAAEGGGDAHGTVSALSAQDKADLVEYLRSR